MFRPTCRARGVLSVCAAIVLLALLPGCSSKGSSSQDAPLAITSSALPDGQVDKAYSATLSATGGATPYSWALTSGTLPAGLSLDTSSGAITGTPSVSVSGAPLTFQVSDSKSPAQDEC